MKAINPTIFKTYDIRGIYPKELDKRAAFLIGQVCARKFTAGTFILGYDIRLSSKQLLSSFLSGFSGESKKLGKKFKVQNIGLVTTPMFYFWVNKSKASGGAIATASHNPAQYGGLKIVGPKAKMVSGKEIEKFVNLES